MDVRFVNMITGMAQDEPLPSRFFLGHNYPNPFNPSTTIRFEIPQKTRVVLKVYDALGRVVETLRDEELPAGKYQEQWYARTLPSGVYFCRIQAGDFQAARKMLLMR